MLIAYSDCSIVVGDRVCLSFATAAKIEEFHFSMLLQPVSLADSFGPGPDIATIGSCRRHGVSQPSGSVTAAWPAMLLKSNQACLLVQYTNIHYWVCVVLWWSLLVVTIYRFVYLFRQRLLRFTIARELPTEIDDDLWIDITIRKALSQSMSNS